jgi:hypothetical protein
LFTIGKLLLIYVIAFDFNVAVPDTIAATAVVKVEDTELVDGLTTAGLGCELLATMV